jgi:hypothetical protein
MNLLFIDFITALAVYSDSSENISAIERFHRFFILQTMGAYESSLEFLRPYVMEDGKLSHVNKYLYEYVETQLEKVTPYVIKPSYLINRDKIAWSDEEGTEDPTSVPFILPDSSESGDIINALTEKFIEDLGEGGGMDKMEIRNGIRREYETNIDNRMKLRFIQPIHVDIFEIEKVGDVERFRQWGPSNPFVSSSKTEEKQSSRMLTCSKFVAEDEKDFLYIPSNEEDYMPFDWFTGNCEVEKCKKRIRWYHHAVRIPQFDGGWVGCFCSWKCATTTLEKEITELVDVVSPRTFQKILLKIFKKQINKIKIYDRPFPSPEEEEDDPSRKIDPRVTDLVLKALKEEEEGEDEDEDETE